jgi:hypothetical protein
MENLVDHYMPAQGRRTSTPKKSLDFQKALFPAFFRKRYFLYK